MLKNLIIYLSVTLLGFNSVFAQLPQPAMVGYWENWGGNSMVKLKDVDPRYNVICVAFTENDADYDVKFTPASPYSKTSFKSEVAQLQAEGRKIIISIGGANGEINIRTEEQKNIFVSSLNTLVDEYGFDGLDIDIEGEESLDFDGIKINNRNRDVRINFLIDGIKEVMANHQSTHGKKLLLTMAPETMYVHGALSPWEQPWNKYKGAYLPIIEELRDEIDMLNVQLYNSGSMYGLDGPSGGEFHQGSIDWVLALTEAVIRGFEAEANIGTYSGLAPSKVGVGLPGCHSSDAVPHDELILAMNYLLGKGEKPGNYTLKKEGGYPDLAGMMTWSITSDKRCNPSYGFVDTFEKIFSSSPRVSVVPAKLIFEGEEDGSVLNVKLNNDDFVQNLSFDNWSITNLPEGVSIGEIRRIDNKNVTIILSGSATKDYIEEYPTITITIEDGELSESIESLSATSRPFRSTPSSPALSVPSLVQAEDFYKSSNNGIRSSDHSVNNKGNTCVDVRTAFSNDLEYFIDVEETGTYYLAFYFASGTGTVEMNTFVNGESIGKNKITTNEKFKTFVLDEITLYLEQGKQFLYFDLVKHWMYLDHIEFSLSPTLSFDAKSKKNTIEFFPNPANNKITINTDTNGLLTLFNLSGSQVLQQKVSSAVPIDISTLAKGMYLVEFTSANGVKKYNKLIKE